jgi:hypothetical protein
MGLPLVVLQRVSRCRKLPTRGDRTTKEKIQPENNRTFKTGSGSWSGPLVWHPGELDLHRGYITVGVPPASPGRTISLSYPSINPAPGKTHGFQGAYLPISNPLGEIVLTWTITDGGGGSFSDTIYLSTATIWTSFVGSFVIPPGWNTPGTMLYLTLLDVGTSGGLIALDDFSLLTAEKIMYLPFVGVG